MSQIRPKTIRTRSGAITDFDGAQGRTSSGVVIGGSVSVMGLAGGPPTRRRALVVPKA